MKCIKQLLFFGLCLGAVQAEEPIYGNSTSPYLEANFFHRVISLTPNKSGVEGCPVIEQEIDEADGFYIEVEKSFGGSFQNAHSWWFPDLSQWAVVGLGPKANHYVIFFGKSFGEDAVKKFKDRKLPIKKEELDQWNQGDAVFWNSEGGAVVGVGTGISPFHIGSNYNIRGSWANYVEKTGENKVFVSLINRTVQSVSVSAGVLYTGGGIDWVKDNLKSRSYEVALVDEAHERAYREFLRGDERPLQALLEAKSEHVTPIEVINGRKLTREIAFGISNPVFPILSWRVNSNRFGQGEHGEASWGTVRDKFWGGYSWQKKYRALHLDFRRFKQFKAGTQVAQEPDWNGGTIEKIKHFASLEYIFEADHGRETRLENQFENFLETTGLYQYCIQIPDFKRSLKYHGVKHNIEFADSFVKRLIGLSKTGELTNYLERKGIALIPQLIEENQRIACGKKNAEKCQEKLEKSFAKHLEDVQTRLDELATVEFNSMEMAKTFAKLGKEIVSSPVMYRLFFEEGKKCGMESSFEVSGQRISQYRKDETFAASDSCFID